MKRRLILILATLGGLFGAFYVYTLVVGPDGFGQKRDPNAPAAIPPPIPAPGQTGADSLRQARDVEIITRDERGRLEGIYRADRWDRGVDGVQVLTNPRVLLFQKDGTQLNLRADRAEVYGEELNSGANVRRAKLEGDVRVYFDPSTEDNRLPFEQRLHELVRVYVDKVEFNRERLSITTDPNARVTVFSRDADIYGYGLTVSWDESPGELRLLRMERGEYMAVYNVPAELEVISQPGEVVADPNARADANAAPETMPSTTPASTPATGPATASAPATGPATATAPARREARNQYRAEFHQGVKVVHRNRRLTGARLLSLEFDWSESWRSDSNGLLSSGPAETQPAETQPAETQSAETQPATRRRGEEPMEIYWSGPLVIRPVGWVKKARRESFKVSAEGPRVILTDPNATVLCSRFRYENPQRIGRIEGREGQPVRLLLAEGADVSCRRIHTEPNSNDPTVSNAWLHGAGHMAMRFEEGLTQERAVELIETEDPDILPASERITWGESVELTFVEQVRRKSDGRVSRRPSIREALFLRDVELLESPDPNGDMLQCRDSLRVTMARGRGGATIPKTAVAIGQVRGRQEGSDLEAGKVTVNFVEARPKPGRRGDGGSRGMAMQTGDARILPDTVVAEGGVKITDQGDANDPDDTLTATALRMVSELIPGPGEKRTAVLTGTKDKPVRIRQGDNSFIGEEIHLDQTDDSARVNGPGKLTFVTDRDMEGRPLEAPRLIDVTWAKKMTFSGKKKTAGFVGDAKLSSELDNFSAQELQLVFTDPLPDANEPEPARPRRGAPATGAMAVGMEQYSRRRISMIYADRDIVLASKRLDERNRLLRRMQLTGEKLIYDAESERITMLGGGTFINEDYSPPRKRKITGSDGVMPAVDRPSQTAFEWKKSMEMSQAERVVTLERGVTMVHRSGDQILLARKLNVPRDTWGVLPEGRKTILKCGSMMAKFGEPEEKPTTRPGEAQSARSGGDPLGRGPTLGPLDLFSAKRDVNLKDGPRQVLAQRLIYNRAKDLAVVWGFLEGKPPAKASIIVEQPEQGRAQTWSSPKLIWYRQDNRILAEDVTGGGGR